MKHIKPLNEYFSNFNEGLNFNDASDADLYAVGTNLLSASGDNPAEDADDSAVEKLAADALKNSKPVSLTGKIKTDAPKVIAYIVDAFKRAGVELDAKGATLHSPNFANEIEIPVVDCEGVFFQTMLHYEEIAYAGNGKNIVLSGGFATEDEGNLDYYVSDLNNNREIVQAAEGFKKWCETQK